MSQYHNQNTNRFYGIFTTIETALQVATVVSGRRITNGAEDDEHLVRFHYPYSYPSRPQSQLIDACVIITKITAAGEGYYGGFNERGPHCFLSHEEETTTTRVQLRAHEYTNALALPEQLTTPTPPMLRPHTHRPQSLPPPGQYIYLVITLPTVIPISNLAGDRADRLSMSTIRGMFANPHDACLLATYLMDMSIVVSTSLLGWKYVDKPGVTLIDYSFDDYISNNNHEWPPTHTIGRISILFIPKNLFSPTTPTGAFLHDYLPGFEHYLYIARSTLLFHPITTPPTPQRLHTKPARH